MPHTGAVGLWCCARRDWPFSSASADLPGAWFPGPVGPHAAWFPGIGLSRDFERVKVTGTPMKSPFCFDVFWGQILAVTIYARRQPNYIKDLFIGLKIY